MRCVCCEVDIPIMMDLPISDPGTDYDTYMWDGGVVHYLIAGYGSNYDAQKIFIAICDNCIAEKLKSGVLIQDKNYRFRR